MCIIQIAHNVFGHRCSSLVRCNCWVVTLTAQTMTYHKSCMTTKSRHAEYEIGFL